LHHPADDDDPLWSRGVRQAGPLGLGPVLEVNTEGPVDVAPVCRELEALMAAGG